VMMLAAFLIFLNYPLRRGFSAEDADGGGC